MTVAILYLIIYIIILGFITWQSARQETAGEYINSDKKLSAQESMWTTFASLLTGYNFVVGVTLSYIYGLWYLAAFIGAGLAFVILYLFYKKRLLVLHNRYNLFSIGDYFGWKYGPTSKFLTNTILCGGLILFLTLQIFVNTDLFSTMLDIGKITAILLTTGIVSLYLWIGGFKTSIKTDIFQGILMLPIVLTILFFPIHITANNLTEALDPGLWQIGIGLMLLQFLSLLGQAESFQRIFASKDTKVLKKGLIMALLLLVLVAGAIAYLGINFKLGGGIVDPTNLFVGEILTALPKWLGSLLAISLVAAFMGTMDSSIFAWGVIMPGVLGIKQPTLINIRLFMLGGIVISAIMSLFFFSLLSPVFALISLISVAGGALLISFVLNPVAIEINVFLLVGVILFVLGLFQGFITEDPLTAIIPSGGALIAVLSMIFYRKIRARILR